VQKKSIHQYYPVRGWSFLGRLLLIPLKALFKLIAYFNKSRWGYPLKSFEENPAYFTWKDALYLGAKYYGKPHESGQIADSQRSLKEITGQADRLMIHAGGDLMPYEVMMNGRSDELWSLCGEDFFGSDITMANLETPMDFFKKPSYVPELMLNDMQFNGSRALLDVFTAHGSYSYDYLSLANNHMLDAGTSSLKETMQFLDSRKIPFSGARRHKGENDFVILQKNGFNIGIVNYTYSLNRVNPDDEAMDIICHLRLNDPLSDIHPLFDALKAAKSQGAEVVIASLHMGNAYQCYPSEHIRNRVLEIFEFGEPDVIFIHHPHNLQPSEVVHYHRKSDGKEGRGIVYYSLGDFVAYDIFSWSHLTGYATLELAKTPSGEVLINSGFKFLYLHCDKMGNFRFIPWDLAQTDKKYQDDHYFFLKDWYDRHACNFFQNN